MRKSELINALNAISEEDFEVCIFDWRQNIYKYDGENAEGIYSDFKVELENNDSEFRKHDKFISLAFKNEDYSDDGIRLD